MIRLVLLPSSTHYAHLYLPPPLQLDHAVHAGAFLLVFVDVTITVEVDFKVVVFVDNVAVTVIVLVF